MVIVFLVGYLMIALEHPLKINKAGTALLIGTVLWVMYTYAAPFFIPRASAEEFSLFLESFPSLGSLTFKEQCTRFVVEHQVLDSIGEIAETLIFLIGAMITVELIEAHGLPVTLWDERRTTIAAHDLLLSAGKNGRQRKKTVDAVAAALILEGFLTFRSIRGETP